MVVVSVVVSCSGQLLWSVVVVSDSGQWWLSVIVVNIVVSYCGQW